MREKLSVENSSLVQEWDYDKNGSLKPSDLKPYSNRKVWWLCKNEHSWEALVSSRTGGKGCPYCAGLYAIQGVNDFATLLPELALEWDYEKNGDLRPNQVKIKSGQKAWWLCEYGHSWKAVIHARSNGNGCPVCKNLSILSGYNDLATLNPELSAEWDIDKNMPLLPSDVGANSGHKVWWQCKHKHSWQAQVKVRNNGIGCPICAGKQIQSGINDLASRFPELVQQWDHEKNGLLLPNAVAPFSIKRVWWRCDKSHSWCASISNRARGNGCPYCSGQAVLPGFNDLATLNPTLADTWDYDKNDGLTPEMVTVSSSKVVWWRCSLGHSWKTTISHRNDGSNCPYCANLAVLTGYNDLKTVSPELLVEWDYEKNILVDPEKISIFSRLKVWWKCKNGHSWYSAVSGRALGNGCPICVGKRTLRPRLVR